MLRASRQVVHIPGPSWTEGPQVWDTSVIFSDTIKNRIYRWELLLLVQRNRSTTRCLCLCSSSSVLVPHHWCHLLPMLGMLAGGIGVRAATSCWTTADRCRLTTGSGWRSPEATASRWTPGAPTPPTSASTANTRFRGSISPRGSSLLSRPSTREPGSTAPMTSFWTRGGVTPTSRTPFTPTCGKMPFTMQVLIPSVPVGCNGCIGTGNDDDEDKDMLLLLLMMMMMMMMMMMVLGTR